MLQLQMYRKGDSSNQTEMHPSFYLACTRRPTSFLHLQRSKLGVSQDFGVGVWISQKPHS